jgi:hypothetical protein
VRSTSAVISLLLLALGGCRRGGSHPSDIHIDVEIEGAEAPPITRARLEKMSPTYDDGQRRGWPLADFFGWLYARPDIALEVEDHSGQAARFERPGSDPEGRELLLLVDREGTARVARRAHGEKPSAISGDQKAPVRKLRLVLISQAAAPVAPVALAVDLDGKSRNPLQLDDLGPATMELVGDGGAKRSGWSLRELVARRVDRRARVVAVVGAEGTVEISARDWNDGARIPVLRLNRRHTLRLQWMAADGSAADGPGAREVRGLRLVSR